MQKPICFYQNYSSRLKKDYIYIFPSLPSLYSHFTSAWSLSVSFYSWLRVCIENWVSHGLKFPWCSHEIIRTHFTDRRKRLHVYKVTWHVAFYSPISSPLRLDCWGARWGRRQEICVSWGGRWEGVGRKVRLQDSCWKGKDMRDRNKQYSPTGEMRNSKN